MDFTEKYKKLKRKQLDEKMKDILEMSLMFLVAPMGYGKTSVVRSFFDQHKELNSIWLSLGQDEVDEEWVWNKLCGKVQFINTSFCGLLTQLGLPRTNQEINYFIECLKENLTQPYFIVFDDYHECNRNAINQIIIKLAYEEIKNLHLVIISRVYPKFPYQEMRLKGCSSVIDQYSLTMSKEEVAEFFAIYEIQLSLEELEQVYTYTDGWISAVYLVLLDYKKTGRVCLSASVLKLLKESIFEELPERVKDLFMKMSLFDDFTVEEAAYITRQDIQQITLYELAEKIGFLQYDSVNNKYAMHSLLRSIAAAELSQRGIDKKELYIRCGEWKEKNKNSIEAIICYRKAKDTERIFCVLQQENCYALFQKAPFIFKDFFENLDLEIRLDHEMVYLSYIYYLNMQGEWNKGIALFKEADEKYKERYGESSEYKEIKSQLLIIEALIHFNDLEATNRCMKQSYELSDGRPSILSNTILMTFGIPETLTLYFNKTGNLRKIVELEKEYAKYYMALINKVSGGCDSLFEAEYLFTTGNIEAAKKLAEVTRVKAKFRKQLCIVISAYYLLLRCDVYSGDRQGFEQKMKELKEQMKGIAHPVLVLDYELAISHIYTSVGMLDKIPVWLQDFKLDACNRIVKSIRSGCISYAVLLRQKKEWALLDAIAETMFIPYETATHIYVRIYAFIYKAISTNYLEGRKKAADFLKQGLELAEQDQIIMPFVENAEELLPILEVLKGDSLFVQKIIPYSITYLQGLKAFAEQKDKGILSKRERELMQLVKDGKRNNEISERMNIAQVTVEKTLTNIYRKLNVTNRTAAIAKLEKLEHPS